MSCEEDTAKSARAVPSIVTDELLTARQVAKLTGHPETVLAVYRSRRNTGQSPHAGPEFLKLGHGVYYPRAAVDEYVAKRGA